ncbi:hypothetical protein [Allosphingosinicella indica]|uniref:LexA repressor DNA-binding domain-containing protein n=1 Tax=Allosphingosinicella indica TaxID=941907 RepID=A0A1X7GKC0_9SPHN|nr:hypothetical protein [Allosphingosinicella indica]SMF70641.1 hypothetical protein SAMN06295910_1920 [Allosphingosinicella indica]
MTASVSSPPEMDAWLAGARPGERFVYCSAPALIRGPAAEHARLLYERGRVDLLQPRRADGRGFDYQIVKRALATAPAGDMREDVLPGEDAVLSALRRAANFQRRCPTNTELARAAGLATAQQAAWRIARLEERGLIRVATIKDGPEAGWRTVTIVRSGKQTKRPPSARDYAASLDTLGMSGS